MALVTKAARGVEDRLPREIHKWHTVERVTREIAERYGCKEIRTPTFEHTELFLRGVGGTTDVVQKEMYTFEDKKGRSLTLKPEGTAGVARAAVEHGLLADALPLKVFYYTSCFRYEAPQSGRLREHHQFGAEFFGADEPDADAGMIALAGDVLSSLGLSGVSLFINSIGCPECRPKYHAALRAFFEPRKEELCSLCKERLERNPLRLLDCKVDSCKSVNKDAPSILDYLCGDCEAHFSAVKSRLTLLGIDYTVDSRIVRGLDYYTGTVFEFVPQRAGSQTTICAGGRYNGLVSEIGGTDVPGLGFGMGLERLILEMDASGAAFDSPPVPAVFVAFADAVGKEKAAVLVSDLRRRGVAAEADICGRGLKSQLKYAGKISAGYSLVIGETEITNGAVTLKNMADGSKIEVALEAGEIAAALK